MSHQACPVCPVRCNWQRLALVVTLALGLLPLSSCSSQLRSSGPSSHGPLGTLAAEFPLTTTAGPDDIAAGPDGNLWFTEQHGDRIGRITPTGTIAEFALAPNSHPRGIAAGPDGNLWVTEPTSNRIGRFTPTMGTSS